MLNIHSFLQGKGSRVNKDTPVKNLGTDSSKLCFIIALYSLIAIVIVLTSERSDSHQVGSGYAKAETVQDYFKVEETAQNAQIQSDENVVLDPAKKIISGIESIANAPENQELIQFLADLKQEEAEKEEQEAKEALEAEKKAEAKKAKEKEEAKAALALKKEKKIKEESKYKIHLSAKERSVLERIVEAEATGESLKGKMLVANVILNRVNSNRFPHTVAGVVFQKNGRTYQFSPIKDGRYWRVSVSKETKKAVDRVLSGSDRSQGALYFSARSKADKSSMSWFDHHLKWLFRYGGHEFYR